VDCSQLLRTGRTLPGSGATTESPSLLGSGATTESGSATACCPEDREEGEIERKVIV